MPVLPFISFAAVAMGMLNTRDRFTAPALAPALFNVVAHWCVGLPFGAWLAFRRDLGLVGLWMGLTAGLFVVAMLLVARLYAAARRADSKGLFIGG